MAPPEVTVVPLLGQRQPIRELDTVALDTVARPAAAWPATPERTAAEPGAVTPGVVSPGVVQRPVAGRMVTGSYEQATGPAGGPPVRVQRELPNRFADPGADAIARGLAHRAADGSVVFGMHRAPELSVQDPPALPDHDQSASFSGGPSFSGGASPSGGSGPSGTVQRQEATGTADPPAPPVGSPPSTVAAPAALATPAAPAAPGPASPPLDELARQLFGPLAARLKAELRLDRERAGLLTDLRH